MRKGRLDRQIDIERRSDDLNSAGDAVPIWTKIATRRWASYRPLRGEERFTANQFIAKQQVEFTVQYSVSLADVSPLDRVIYPPFSGEAAATPKEQIYDIMEVAELGRREGIRIRAARRAETGGA